MCAVSVAGVSLISSHMYRREPAISALLMALVSFLPGFLYGAALVVTFFVEVPPATWFFLIIKNIFYSASFYLRYESLRKFGAFKGALMSGAQPLLVSTLGFIILGEALTDPQMWATLIVGVALLVLARDSQPQTNVFKWKELSIYFMVPTLLSSLTVIADRFLLKRVLTTNEFFILDRLSLPATFAIVVLIICLSKKNHRTSTLVSWPVILKRQWLALLSLSGLFTLSVYFYNVALSIENAALVNIFRNAGYPLAAFAGVFIFKERTSGRKYLSLLLIILATALSAA